MVNSRLFLIDANAFCYRAFYALKDLSTTFGQPTNAIYGFINILNKILKDNKPEFVAACFDVSRDTFRQKKFAEYKIQRPPMPDGLSSQIPLIKQIISAYRIAIFEKEGYEADDVIATLSRKAKDKGLAVTIVSSDKDILQLVDDNTVVFSPYKDKGILYDKDKVLERFGVEPRQIPDVIALMGDSADNIPNVPGIGEVSAESLVKAYGSIENLLENSGKIKQEKIRKAINDNTATIKLNKELALLEARVEIDFDLDSLKLKGPDFKELFRLFKYLEFKKFLKNLPVSQEEAPQEKEIPSLSGDELKNLVGPQDELVLYGQSFGNLVFYAGNKSFRLGNAAPEIGNILKDPGIKKTSHDLKKIRLNLIKDGLGLEGLYFDTMIAGYLLNPSKSSYDLNDVAWDYLGKQGAGREISNQEAVDLIVELRPKLEAELRDKQLLSLFNDIEMPLVEVLAEMELCGVKLDLEVLKDLSGDVEIRLTKLIGQIYDLSGTQFNINSPKQLREVLFERLKLPVFKKSKTGPSTDEEVLRNLSSKHELPKLLLEYRQLMKLKNTYIDVLPQLVDPGGRIHTSFNQAATETGRLSSSNPNLQNIPIKTEIGKHIRRAIISSDKGGYLISCDYSQVELRILAHLSKDEELISAFKEGKDIHKITASLIYGLQENDVSEPMREVAKRVNFGIVYGQTSYGLSRDLGIPVDGAQGFIDAYFLRYPRVKEYIEKQIEKAESDGYVTTISGRRRYIPEIKNRNQGIRQFAQRQAVNTPIQGSASDLIKLAMIDIHKQLNLKKLKAKMVLQVHDELVFDVSAEELGDLVILVKDRMENVLKLDVPIKVDIKKGKNWLETEEVK